jgi:hypothetical protein
MHRAPKQATRPDSLSTRLLDFLRSRPATIEQLKLVVTKSPEEIGRTLDDLEDAALVTRNETGAYTLKADSLSLQTRKVWECEFYQRQQALPRPHELDGDWRFTFEAALDLIHLTRFALSSSDSVCCLGTPSIAILLDIIGFDGKITLVDYNHQILASLSATCPRVQCIQFDFMQSTRLSKLGKHGLLFVDPPWAGDYCRKFAARALSVLLADGIGCMVYFPSYNRKTAPERQRRIIETLTKLHARIITILPERVRILERGAASSINSSGVRNRTGLKGTVCIFEKIRTGGDENEKGWDLPITGRWRAFDIANSRWMLRVDGPLANARLVQIRPLPVRRTMSRYDQGAQLVGLWTSGGQLFRVIGSNVVAILLREISEGATFDKLKASLRAVPLTRTNERRIRRLWNQLKQVARKEQVLP